MKSTERKGFETLGEAASRLLRRLDEKAKRPGAESAPEIQIDRDGPSCPVEKGREGIGGVQPSRPVIANAGGVSVSGREVAELNGSPVFRGKFVGYANDNGLPNRENCRPERTREVYTLPVVKG
jgi:hypothetical protein